MANLNVALNISANTSQATGGLNTFGRALGNVAQTAAGFVLAGGLMSLPGLLMDAASAAADDEASTMRLSQAIKNLGGDVEGHTKQVNAAIEAGQRLGFTDDDIRDSYIKLTAATGSSEEALTRQQAAMDLARGANISLEQASRMLGKINADNVEVFKRMGITIGENATEADALAAVQAKFGNQADAYAQSTKGQMEAANIAFDEMKESLGYVILPLLTKLGGIVTANLPAIQSFVGLLGKGLSVSVGILSAEFDLVAKAISPFVNAIRQIQDIVDKGGIEGLKETFPAVGQALAYLQPPFDHLVTSLQDLGREISQSVKPLLDALGPAFEALAPIVGTVLVLALDGLITTFGIIIDVFKVALPIAINIAVGVIDTLTVTIQTISKIVAGVVKLVTDIFHGDWKAAWIDAKQIVQGTFDGINKIASTMTAALDKVINAALKLIGIDWDGFWKGLPGTIATTFTNAAGAIHDAGAGIIASLISGLDSAVGNLKTWVKVNITDAIPQYIRDLLGIASPSKVMAEIGENMIAGLQHGMETKLKSIGGSIVGGIANVVGGALGGGATGSIADFINATAPQYGIDSRVAIQVAQSEGGLSSWNAPGDQNTNGVYSSFGPFQMHYGNLGFPHSSTGLGDAFTRATGLDARNASAGPAATEYALQLAAAGGWGPWHGWKGSPWAGISRHAQGGWLTEPILGMGLRSGQMHSFVENGRPEYVSPAGSMHGGAPLEVHVYIGDREITDLVVKTVDKASRTGQLRAVVR